MEIPLRKVTARVDLKAGNTFVRTQPKSRPGSPTKQSPSSSLSPPSFRPKAKVNSAATVRKLSSSSSLSAAQINNVSTPSNSRPNSPFKPSRTSKDPQASNSPRARILARPTSRSGMGSVQTMSSSPEPRQRALTAASANLKPPHLEDRPRSGSVATLHHALSTSDHNPTFSPPTLQPSPLGEHVMIDLERRTNASPILAPLKIKSKVTKLAKSLPPSAVDPTLRSLSPPYATTRPIHRTRAPSITSSTFSLNDPPTPSPFYPITTASPAANPHRFAPRRAPSPVRSFTSPPTPSEPFIAKKIPLAPKIDPASVPLPPHSPPISAISISTKSSVSRTSISLNGDQTPDNQISSLVSHTKRASMERISQPNVFYPPSEVKALAGRDRSRSRDRSLLTPRVESDAESEGPERHLRAEAKTNRKIADLEITNRSLLAINASLETTKNRQAKEIRDLRRKLRESRLILPPPTYKAVESKEAAEHDRDEDDEDDDEDDDSSEADEGAVDEAFQRVRSLIDSLIESGKQALETKPEDFRASLATKVLNADELRSWRFSGERIAMESSYVDKQDADDETIHSSLSPALIAVPDSDSESLVGSEGEEVLDPPSSLPPPITITHSL